MLLRIIGIDARYQAVCHRLKVSHQGGKTLTVLFWRLGSAVIEVTVTRADDTKATLWLSWAAIKSPSGLDLRSFDISIVPPFHAKVGWQECDQRAHLLGRFHD